ncbi:archaetidylserine decarboxylase [Alteriqipengyuania flavescens]|uniref:archaetidylserine decarboxylase n=1 Tax=Alteriqipengyuania flavescens TaxID=3053610 RepID=UPI0025B576F9|nr:archaetidylserine decarboxylase [Alteriqipengyuania flavescens]WJY19381.1 archaetidylserine decarboxylase [Alteriqipengyuania flavescens]WJY25323.1 archaetidylserine decarboxylase [Alteriqipengyuania flavescens]
MTSPFILAQHLAPHQGLSRFAGRIARSTRPWLKDRLIRRFIDTYDVDMGEAERPAGDYTCFNDFFTRALKPGARPLAEAASHVLCPADGAISQLGRITDGRIVQAKRRDYTAQALLGGDAELASRFAQGDFATIYLSPRDYHRVHMPVDGTLRRTIYVPGDLFSVNTATADRLDQLFARNERLVCIFDTPLGTVASVMVGAMIVASIETVWGGLVEPHGKRVVSRDYTGIDAPTLKAGDEMGRFLLGSTVILLFEEGRVRFEDRFEAGTPTRMGEALARKL